MAHLGNRSLPPYLSGGLDGKIHFHGPYGYLQTLPGLNPQEILNLFDTERKSTLNGILNAVRNSMHPFHGLLTTLKNLDPDSSLKELISDRGPVPDQFLEFFMMIQEHVYSHPIWKHPFLEKFTTSELTLEQMQAFARQFFNYSKNADQNVALSVGRFYTLIPGKRSGLSERISEITRHVLAQLIADEFHINSRRNGDEFPFETLSHPTTSVARYRDFMAALQIPFQKQDEAMTHGMADLVLVQRILAGGESFTELESLASVAAGHFWGTPELYAIFLRGVLHFAQKQSYPTRLRELEGFTFHSATDMSYALSFMLILFLHIHHNHPEETVKNVMNILLACKFNMLSDLHGIVFGETPTRLYEMEGHREYLVSDRRIELELSFARQKTLDDTVIQMDEYKDKKTTPFIFKD